MRRIAINKIIASVLMVSALIGCTDEFLKEDVKGKLTSDGFPGNKAQLEESMQGLYNASSRFCNEAAIVTRNAGTEELTSHDGHNKYYQMHCDDYTMHLNQKNDLEPRDIPIWDGCYGGIKQANWLLAKVINASKTKNSGSDITDDKVIELAKGQAYFMRAMLYFNLTRYFGKVPLVVSIDVDKIPTQLAEFSEIYAQIIEDLNKADEILPKKWDATSLGATANQMPASWRGNKAFPTQGWVRALRAQVYLTMAGWPLTPIGENPNAAQQGAEAIEYYKKAAADAKDIIDNKAIYGYDLEADFKDLWLFEKQYTVKENIIAMYYNRNGVDQKMAQAYRPETEAGEPYGGWCDLMIERPYYYSYPAGYRKKITFTTSWAKTWPMAFASDWLTWDKLFSVKDTITAHKIVVAPDKFFYCPSISKYRSNVNFPFDSIIGNNTTARERSIVLIRYAHILFIYAEASTRATWSVSGDALDAVNQIRRRANKMSVAAANASVDLPSGLSVNAFLDSLLMEKSYELVGEPESRWHDLVRLDEVYEVALKVKAQRANTSHSLKDANWVMRMENGKKAYFLKPSSIYLHHNIHDLKDISIPADRRLLHHYWAPYRDISNNPSMFTY